jgi:hypothetical protein
MTQGARNTRKPKDEPSNELSLSEWLNKRGLTGEKRLEVSGEWFRFVKAATADQLAAFAEAREQGDLVAMMAALLVDSGQHEELKDAFARQQQPIDAKQEQEYLTAIVNFLVAGDAGESSAS